MSKEKIPTSRGGGNRLSPSHPTDKPSLDGAKNKFKPEDAYKNFGKGKKPTKVPAKPMTLEEFDALPPDPDDE